MAGISDSEFYSLEKENPENEDDFASCINQQQSAPYQYPEAGVVAPPSTSPGMVTEEH